MGYILKDIAEITEPARVSLSGLPNFIQIASKTSGGTRYEVRIAPTSPTAVLVTIQDGGGGIRAIQGTTDPEAVEGSVFFISTDPLETAENLKAALLNDNYIFANYDVYSDISWNAGAPTVNGVVVKAKDIGTEFNLTVTGAGATVTAISAGTSTDSIRGSEPIVEVAVDLYREDAGQYIHTAAPAGSLGAPIITLSKSYNGAPIWFDLNGIAAQNLQFTPPPAIHTWFNTGTLTAYRALVRKGNFSQVPFYISEILYALTGYGDILEAKDFTPYIFVSDPIKTLTEKPATPYIYDQREFINILVGTPLTGKQIHLIRRAYDGAGRFLGSSTIGAALGSSNVKGINSFSFNFNVLLTTWPTTVKLTATLEMGGAMISEPLEYYVRPECLHIRNEFYFLNRLGGWDTFNFDGTTVEENRPINENYNRTVTPSYNNAQGVEATYLADLETVYTVQGAPVGEDVAEWLKQLLASKVILDMDGRRILIEDFTLRVTAGDMSIPTIKYRLSETYTNGY